MTVTVVTWIIVIMATGIYIVSKASEVFLSPSSIPSILGLVWVVPLTLAVFAGAYGGRR